MLPLSNKTRKQQAAINAIAKALLKSQALRDKMDKLKRQADAAAAKLSEKDVEAINAAREYGMPRLCFYDKGGVDDSSWGDCHC